MFKTRLFKERGDRNTTKFILRTPTLLIFIILILMVLGYLFFPFGRLALPPQSEFMRDPDIQRALTLLAEQWDAPEKDLRVLAARFWEDGDTTIAIINPQTLSSATIWIVSPYKQIDRALSAPTLSDRIYQLTEHIPRNTLDRIIARNFYTKSGALKIDAVIVHIDAGIPFGHIRANSLRSGDLQIPTILTYPLSPLAIRSSL